MTPAGPDLSGAAALLDSQRAAITGAVDAGLGASAAALDDVVGGVLGAIAGGLGNLYQVFRDFEMLVTRRLNEIVQAIQQAIAGIVSSLGGFLGQIAGEAGRAVSGLENLPGDFAAALVDTVPDILMGAVTWIAENWETLRLLLAGLFPGFDFTALATAGARFLRGEIPVSELISAGTPQELQNNVWHTAWGVVLALGMATGIIGASSAVGSRTFEQELNIRSPSALAPLGAAVDLERRDLAVPEFVDEMRQRHGLSELQFDALRQAATSELAPGQIIELFNRLGRDEKFLADALKHTGLHERNWPLARELADTLPPPADLIRFAVREVFTPAIAEKFGQFQELESLPVERFEQLGISKEHMAEYWAAHWELPSLSSGYEMYHRTADVPVDKDSEAVTLSDGSTVYRLLGLDGLKSLQRAQDVMPFWRERLEKLAFHPLTRVDIRRLHKEGILSAAGVERAYLDSGYSPENARHLMDFTVALNSQDDDELIRSIRAPIATKALASYVKLYSSKEETEKLLAGLGFEPVQIRYQLAMADHDRIVADADAAASAAKSGYVSGTYNQADVETLLAAQGFRPEATARLIAAWDVARFTRDLSDAEKAQRDLTKAEILAAYSDKVIGPDEAGPLLITTGYDADEASVLIAIEDAKAAKADTTALVAATHADFVAGKLTRGAASGELDKWGVAQKRRDALLRSWDLERGQREAHIGVSDLKDMFKGGIISEGDATEQLTIQGFGAKQIAWYLQSWGRATADQTTRRRTNG